eukprot:2825464-Amphidinium_carterae.1
MLCGGKHKHTDPASMPAPRRRYVSRLAISWLRLLWTLPRAKDVLRQSGQRQPGGLAHLVQVPEYARICTCALPTPPDVDDKKHTRRQFQD